VAVEARNPLNHALDHIKGTTHASLIQAHIDGPFPACFESYLILFSTPLNHSMHHVTSRHAGVREEMVALMPVHQDGNSAAERAILKSMMQSIDSIAHATEVGVSS